MELYSHQRESFTTLPDHELKETPRVSPAWRRLMYLTPVVGFLAIAVFLGFGLTLNPREIPSPLVGEPVPTFSLPPVKGRDLGLATGDLKQEVSLVNVFPS